MSDLQDMAAKALARGPDYPALEWEKRWVSWAEMRLVADALGQLLDASGADPRARVAMLPRSEPGSLAALVGLISRGANICMIHVYQSAAGIARDVQRLRPSVLIGLKKDIPEQLSTALREQGVAVLVLDSMGVMAIPGCERSTAETDAPPVNQQIELLTSGTTGPPKQFSLTYDMLAKHMVGVNMMKVGEASAPLSQPPIYMYLAFSNISGLYLTLPAMMHGVRGVLVDRFTLPTLIDYIVRFRPESVGVPMPAVQMILEADVPKADLASLKWLNTGTAPLDPSIQRAFEDRYGIPILIGYGATEFGGPVSVFTYEQFQQYGRSKLGSVGKAWAGCELRVVDPETGAVLPAGREGLLEVVSPRIGSNWIRSSDIVVIDDDGFLFYRGRADGAIIRGGFKLLPDDIERALMLHEAVSAVGVTGIPDERLGQVPAVAIQLKAGVIKPSIPELEKHLREHVPATHIPVIWRFVDSLPYNAMLKIDRRALRSLFEETAPN